jgi:hypothetical protein
MFFRILLLPERRKRDSPSRADLLLRLMDSQSKRQVQEGVK